MDFVIPWPAYFNLATKLKNKGCNVDVALVWDEGHRVTSETDEFFAFLENIDK